MFINDVIRRVRAAYPSEYGDREMYIWCDEVSAMLAMEDRNMYERVWLPVDEDGGILLPEGVDMENVEYIVINGIEINKRDLRLYGGRRLYVKGRNGVFLPNGRMHSEVADVVYLKPFSPIRAPVYSGGITVGDGAFTLPVGDFEAGDTVNITLSPGTSSELKLPEVPILAREYTDGGTVYTVPEDTFSEVTAGEHTECFTERCVTDKTVCGPPFDTMYVDYLLAKIMLCQHDSESANIHLTLFNSRLLAYKKWLITRMPSGDCRFRNWW